MFGTALGRLALGQQIDETKRALFAQTATMVKAKVGPVYTTALAAKNRAAAEAKQSIRSATGCGRDLCPLPETAE